MSTRGLTVMRVPLRPPMSSVSEASAEVVIPCGHQRRLRESSLRHQERMHRALQAARMLLYAAAVKVTERGTTSWTELHQRVDRLVHGLRDRGLSEGDVVAMLGEPAGRELGGTHWLYGPSWVRFECSQVIDWYSSPLEPLRASRSRPGAEGAAVLARADARPCPPVAAASGRGW